MLISRFLGSQGPQVSHFEAGVADITKEWRHEQNPNLRFHDSQGYEAGEARNLQTLIDFIMGHSGDGLNPNDKLHALW